MRIAVTIVVFALVFTGCKKDSPKHHVKEMVGTYAGTWTFVRNNGTTSETGVLEIYQGSKKNMIYVGPEMVEFELNENLDPIVVGNQYQLSFPYGNTSVIKFERFWDSPYKDEFFGTKQSED